MNSRKKILILGAGIYQLPLIQTAKEMGLFTIVSTIKGDYPGLKLADKVYYVNTTDLDACLSVAKEEKIDAICTAGTDVALPTLGYIVDQMHLPGPSYNSAQLSSNKLLMKNALKQFNVRTAEYRKVYTVDEAISASNELGFPLILKVVDSSGSRGIVVVKSQDEIIANFSSLFQYTRQDYVIIEQFIEGEEFGAQALVVDNKVVFVLPHGDIMYRGKTGVPIGHYVPYSTNSDVLEDAFNQVKNSIRALQIDNAGVNADLIIKDGKVYVLEIGARAGATCLPELVSHFYGIDYYKWLVEVSLGKKEGFSVSNENNRPCAAKLITSSISGVLKSYATEIKNDNLLQYSIDFVSGHKINKFEVGPDRIGQIVVSGSTVEDAIATINDVEKEIRLELV